MAAVKTLQGYVDEGNEVKGRNWTQDRGYGHIDQIEHLTKKFKLTVISTVCANRKGLPKHFRDARGRPEGDYQVLFNPETGMSIHSEIVKKKSGQCDLSDQLTSAPDPARLFCTLCLVHPDP
jgi:hypothetical protein